MRKHKQYLAFGSLACVAAGCLTFATAQPAGGQAQATVPVASDVAADQADGTRHYFIEMQQTAASVTYAQRASKYSAEMKYVSAADRDESLKLATQRAAAEATQQAWVNENAQLGLMSELNAAGLNVQVLYRAQAAINGIAVIADESQLAALESMPGVLRVTEMSPSELNAASSVDFIGTRNFWRPSGLNAHGEGVGVGVVDTGIDHVHTGNGGPGGTNYALGATKTDGSSPANTFPTDKVVWGYDFAGDAYTGSGGSQPVRDPNPMDTNGHGTGCASLIAGFGVNPDGTTYNGSYTDTVPDIATLKISPGIAPQAKLYAFRVFGTSGSTFLAAQAIDVATAVRLWQLSPEGTALPPAIANLNPAPVAVPRTPVLSVMNQSLGSANGSANPYNTDVIAVQNAANAGLSMAHSAGNSYDSFYIVGSAGVATGTTTVAATYNAQLPGFRAVAPANGNQPALDFAGPTTGTALFYNGPVELPPTAARYANPREANFQHAGPAPGNAGGTSEQQLTVALLNDAGQPVSDAQGNPIPGVENPYVGKVVLVDRGDIGFHNKAIAVQRAGGAACIIVNNRPGTMGGMSANPIFPNVTIPTTGVIQQHGALMTNTGAPNTPPARPGLTIELLRQNAGSADEVVDYSSRGPRRPDNRLKPDLSAPAETVTVNSATTGNDVRSFNGTSSSTPHVAGALALLRQITNSSGTNPLWSAEEIKALVMNTATGNPLVGGVNGTIRYAMSRVGVGRLNLNPQGGIPSAVALSTDADFPVSISFGMVEAPVNTITTVDKQFKVVDKSGGTTDRTFNLAFDTVNAVPGVQFSFPAGNSVTVPGGGSVNVNVRITADGTALRHVRDLATTPVQVFLVGPPPTYLARTFPTEAGGNILLTEQGGAGHSMRLSVHSLPRPNANLAVTPETLTLPASSGTQSFTFTGEGINTGDNVDTTVHQVADIKSYAKMFELQFARPSTETDPFFKMAELTHVGVTSDFVRKSSPFTAANPAVLVFAAATTADFNTPGTNSFNSPGTDISVLVDRTGDLVEDITVRSFAWNEPTYGNATNGSNMYLTVTNLFGSSTVSTTGYFTNILQGRPTNTMNNNVQMLPVSAQRLGLTAANSRINYKVRSSYYFGTYVSETPWLTYDLAKPGIDTSAAADEPSLAPMMPGSTVTANVNTQQQHANRSLGAMMVSMWNAPGDRVQAVRAPAQLAFIASRRTHNNVGVRELEFPIGTLGVESRRGAGYTSSNPVGDYTLHFRFSIPINAGTVTKTSGTGTIVSQSISGTDIVVQLTGVTNAQLMEFSVSGVVDELGNSVPTTAAQFGFLVGDVNATRNVDGGDSLIIRNNSGKPLNGAVAGSDLNCDGAVNAGDAVIVRNATPSGF